MATQHTQSARLRRLPPSCLSAESYQLSKAKVPVGELEKERGAHIPHVKIVGGLGRNKIKITWVHHCSVPAYELRGSSSSRSSGFTMYCLSKNENRGRF